MRRIFTLFSVLLLSTIIAKAQTQASAIVMEATSQNIPAATLALNFTWTSGTGTQGRIVVIRDATGVFTPPNGTNITTLGANSDFSAATDKDAGAGIAKVVAVFNGAGT